MIVVEGMDNSGKSSLVKFLSETYDIPASPPCGSRPRDELFRYMEDALRVGRGMHIYDRIPTISEQVYGPVIRRTNVFEEDSYGQVLFEEFINEKPLVIYCCPPIKTILGTIEDRQHMAGVVENATKLLIGYHEFILKLAHEHRVQVEHYDYTHPDSLKNLMRKVEMYLGRATRDVFRG